MAEVPTLPAPAFLALDVQPEPEVPSRDIRIELKRGSATAVVHWPVESASSCAGAARVAALIRIDAVRLVKMTSSRAYNRTNASEGALAMRSRSSSSGNGLLPRRRSCRFQQCRSGGDVHLA